jgi:hypothetical protein
MDELTTYRQDLLSALEEVVSILSEKVTWMPSRTWHQTSHPGDETPHYILSHLCALEEQVYTRQLPCLLTEDTPTLPIFDEQAWMASHYQMEEPVSAIIDEISRLRRTELEWLRGLSPVGWSRLARHPWWGVHALQWWVELQLDEACKHLEQLPDLDGE